MALEQELKEILQEAVSEYVVDAAADVEGFLLSLGASMSGLLQRAAAGDESAERDLAHVKAQIRMLAAQHRLEAEHKIVQVVEKVIQAGIKMVLAAVVAA